MDIEKFRIDKIRLELNHANDMLKKTTLALREKQGKEKHAEQVHYWDGKSAGLELALNILNI
jgi:hypothetical protein